MRMRLYDTAKGQVVDLSQRDPGRLSMYVCGPTVYDYPHIGHGRQALTYDILRRFMESRGIEVDHVSNITDIEDKIIKRANEQGVSTDDITSKYEAEWYSAMDRLNVLRPKQDPHATAYVQAMIDLIATLLANGSAYETSDTIYFSPANVEHYGLLARQSIESLQAGARVETDQEKRSPIDFALWKKTDTLPNWPSPWGAGRPGWHTECVVMSLSLLGDGFDLHSGGLDLAFPHHENERAQAVASGNRFANHWMHHGFIEVGGEKMGKSLNNFRTLTDLLEKHDGRAYRLLVLRSHYRSPIEVVPETIEDAEKGLSRLDDFVRRFPDALTSGECDERFIDDFNLKMEDDLDTPGAVALLFNAVREANSDMDEGLHDLALRKARAVVRIAEVLGLELKVPSQVDDETAQLVAKRDEARQNKEWATADELRTTLESMGWTVEDTPQGTRVSR
jgi:cysteinyl-tRNA synthetase